MGHKVRKDGHSDDFINYIIHRFDFDEVEPEEDPLQEIRERYQKGKAVYGQVL